MRTTAVGLSILALIIGGAPLGTASHGDGGRWGSPRPIQTDKRLDMYGPVIQRGDGSTVAFWTNSGNNHLYSAERPGGGTWGLPVDLSGPGSYVWIHRAVKDTKGEITVAWRGTMDGQQSIWTRRFVDGEWAEPRLESLFELRSVDLELATARGVTAVQWVDYDEETGVAIIKIAVRSGEGEVTILSPRRTSTLHVMYLAVDGKGRPTIVWSTEGRVLVSTYGSDGQWVEEEIGPSAGYKLSEYVWRDITATSNRADSLAVAWRELPLDAPDDPGTTVVRVRSPGESFTPAHAFTSRSTCNGLGGCTILGMAADGDLTAVYPTLLGGVRADVWFTRRDTDSGAWATPRQLAPDISKYGTVAHATARGGGSVVAIPNETAYIVYRCSPTGSCGSPVELNPPGHYKDVQVASARRGAALLWSDVCVFECEFDTHLLSRVYE